MKSFHQYDQFFFIWQDILCYGFTSTFLYIKKFIMTSYVNSNNNVAFLFDAYKFIHQ